MKFFVILISIVLLSILVFNSIKIKIDFFGCAHPDQYPNCEYERDVNILYLNPPEISIKNPNIDPIRGTEKMKITKYMCDPVTFDCQYDLQPITK